jgi:hypothetical protein
VWNETGVADIGYEKAVADVGHEKAETVRGITHEEPDPDSGPAVAAAMRAARRRWREERLAELADFLEREKRWQELRNSVSAYRMRFGCGMPTAEHLEVFRQLYPGRSGTAISGTDLMALGRGSRLDPGYNNPNKIS